MRAKKVTAPQVSANLTFRNLADVQAFKPNPKAALLNFGVLERGKITVVGGRGGVGKSMVAINLALAGFKGKGSKWMGIEVLNKFNTLILQVENGRKRLKADVEGLDGVKYGDSILISDPPEEGIRLDDEAFCIKLKTTIREKKIGLLVIDPWSAVVGSHGIEALRGAMTRIRSVVGYGEKAPAVLILAHTRKSKIKRTNFLATSVDELTGTQALGTDARCVFLLEKASEKPKDDTVLFGCVKNNDGPLVEPSAWLRKRLAFEAIDPDTLESTSDRLSESVIRKAKIVATLSNSGPEMISRDLCDQLGAKTVTERQRVYDSASSLADEGVIIKVKKGRGYVASIAEGADLSKYTIQSGSENTEPAKSTVRSSVRTKGTKPNKQLLGDSKPTDGTLSRFPMSFISASEIYRNATKN